MYSDKVTEYSKVNKLEEKIVSFFNYLTYLSNFLHYCKINQSKKNNSTLRQKKNQVLNLRKG